MASVVVQAGKNKAARGNAKVAGSSIFDLIKAPPPDIQFAFGLVAIIFMMIIPLPPLVLDMLLAISITLSFMILLISVYIKEPLEFSTFPTLLLVTTLFRLALSVATTRNILLDGASGHVSDVVRSFGSFVVGGNYFIGIVIFIILVVINFIVITKGAGRVAEVGARFTLDAMPGKQMAIDADLSAGLIDRDEAKRRRSKVEREASFYGAMDGASKFVRGDAIAAIIITLVNIVVGLALGMLQHHMTFSQAAATFTILTVGDGLVTQLPALIISTAAGIVVTRSGGVEGLSQELSDQMIIHPKVMFACAGLLVAMALIPGLPTVPFGLLSIGFIFLGRYAGRMVKSKELALVVDSKKSKDALDKGPETIESALHIDVLSLEVGVGLIPLVDTKQDGEILDRIVSTRKQFAQEMGIVVPMVMVRDNIQLKPGEYQILLKGNTIGRGNLMVDYLLAMEAADIPDPIDGFKTKEPAYGLDAIWIRQMQKDEASFRGYTVVNCATVVVTHLTKLVEEHGYELLGRQETNTLIEGLKKDYPKVVEEVVAADRLSLGDVVKVLQNLLAEKVSIRDMLTIFETLADYCKSIRHPDALTRHVRKALGRGIIKKYLTPSDELVVVNLDRAVEDLLVSQLQYREDGTSYLSLDPEMCQRLLNNIAHAMENFQAYGTQPILMTGPTIRWDLMRLVSKFVPGLAVVAYDEIPQGIRTINVGSVSL